MGEWQSEQMAAEERDVGKLKTEEMALVICTMLCRMRGGAYLFVCPLFVGNLGIGLLIWAQLSCWPSLIA